MNDTVILFTRNGLGDAPPELSRLLAVNFAGLLAQSPEPPGALLFYGEGVKLACEGSPVIDALRRIEARGASLLLCRTCLDYFGLLDRTAAGKIGGMPDILSALSAAAKVVSA